MFVYIFILWWVFIHILIFCLFLFPYLIERKSKEELDRIKKEYEDAGKDVIAMQNVALKYLSRRNK